MAEERIIRSAEEHKKNLAERRERSDRNVFRAESVVRDYQYSHPDMANLAIKIIQASNADSFVKRVVTIQILSPFVLGRTRSYESIALEQGASVRDVEQAIKYGAEIIMEALSRYSVGDNIGRANSDSAVENAVKELGKA